MLFFLYVNSGNIDINVKILKNKKIKYELINIYSLYKNTKKVINTN